MVNRIAITPGEPAGIGPDLCVMLAQNPPADTQLVVVADASLLQQRAAELGLPLSLKVFDESSAATPPGELSVLHVELAEPVVTGQLNPANANYVRPR